MDFAELERLEELAKDRGYVVGMVDSALGDAAFGARVVLFDLAQLSEGGVLDTPTMALRDVEEYIRGSSS